MIAPGHSTESDPNEVVAAPEWLVIARYGKVPQVARFGGHGERPDRDAIVRVTTDRGEELAHVLGTTNAAGADLDAMTGQVLHIATEEDQRLFDLLALESETDFSLWEDRIRGWKMQLQLIDIERTLDRRLILYVLNERGPETTRLALLAAAGGHGIIHVQPVTSDGIPPEKAKGGCGDCGCST